MTVGVQIATTEDNLTAIRDTLDRIQTLTQLPAGWAAMTVAEKLDALFGADPHEHLIPGLGVTR